jgi:hypothetical protein
MPSLYAAWSDGMETPLLTVDVPEKEEELEMLLQNRLGGRVHDLRVVLRPDGMILQGHASTYHAKQLAQHAAMEAARLPIVANEIEVR